MKISRSSVMAIVAASSTAASSAFTANAAGRPFMTRSSFLSRSLPTGSGSGINKFNTASLSMNIFTNLFSSLGSGGYEAKIDYTSLDYPGPELGAAALAGQVVVPSDPTLAAATFAGGCFWGLELAYQRVPGVSYTAVGYTQGPELTPTYSQVCGGGTGHTEAVIVYYDPKQCSYEALLDTFFARVDPTTVNGQGNDRGTQYRTGVYFHTPEQEALAKARFDQAKTKYNRPLASECKSAMPFWPAEKYHQQVRSTVAGVVVLSLSCEKQ
jgi:peptide-methionine (S)-S-oxide reductase